ncbi:MAG: 30S ribosomal protein S1 [Chloroflexia bacterium]
MNEEHPTQPTDVLPEQDGTLNNNQTGASNGIARAEGPGGAENNAHGEAMQAGDQAPIQPGPIDMPLPDPDLANGGDAAPVQAVDIEAGPAQAMDVTAPDMGDLPPAGTGAAEVPPGEPAIAPEVADAFTPFHPAVPVGGTPEEAPIAAEMRAYEPSTGAPPTVPSTGEPEPIIGAPTTPTTTEVPEVATGAPPTPPAPQTDDQSTEYGLPGTDPSSPPLSPQSSAPSAEEDGEVAVVRIARDPRLTEMAPNASMEDLLKASEQQYRALKHGDVIEGTVMKVGRDELLVDIGSKSEGIIPSHELQSLTEAEREAMQVGDELLVSVVQPENNEGHAILSLDRARQEKSWRDLQKQFEGGEVIQAEVSGYNKGGLLVNLGGVRGFVPSSQVSSMAPGEANKQAEMAKLQGKTLPLKIIEINRSRNRLILSERQALQEQRESMRSRLLRELEHGQIRPGTVSSICDFGAFVDIGGADGLIHLSELSWKRVSHPSEVLKVGEHINVYVLSVDPNERKIALSLKRTQPEPWTTITENYQLGQIVRGTITQLTSFGAFARLEDGIEGLIHVSELAEGRVAHPKNVVKEGDVVDLKVIRIDPGRKRIGLSLKRVNEDTESPGASQPEGTSAGAVDEDTAAQARQAPAPMETQPQVPSRIERFERQERPERQERQERQSQRSQPRPEPGAGIQIPSTADDEPLSAMAHAFAARAQSLQAAAEEEEEETPAPPAAATPDLSTAAPEAEASMPSAAAMETAEDISQPSAFAATSEPDASVSEAPETGETEDTTSTLTAMSLDAPSTSELTDTADTTSGGIDLMDVTSTSAANLETTGETADTADTEVADTSRDAGDTEEAGDTEDTGLPGDTESAPSGSEALPSEAAASNVTAETAEEDEDPLEPGPIP